LHTTYRLLITHNRPHPPSSTLFPYTTLFRSYCKTQTGQILFPSHHHTSHFFNHLIDEYDLIQSILKAGKCIDYVPMEVFWGIIKDRKSTRLNSSHVSISYAVFCLKKKKK